jgi:hypothetical protein
MRRMRLTTAAQEPLEYLFKTTNDRRLRDRCQAVLMASRSRKRKTIAQDLGGIAPRCGSGSSTITNGGVEGLQIHWAPGQPRRIPETLVPTIQAWVKAGPAGCGARSGALDLRRASDVCGPDHGERREADGDAGLWPVP